MIEDDDFLDDDFLSAQAETTEDDKALFSHEFDCKAHWGLELLVIAREKLVALRPSEAFRDYQAWEVSRADKLIQFRMKTFGSKFTETLALLDLLFGQVGFNRKSPFNHVGRFNDEWMGMTRAHRWFDDRKLPVNARVDTFSYDLACHLAARALEKIADGKKIDFPPDIARFAVDVLRGEVTRPRKQGSYHLLTWMKRLDICAMVQIACDNGLSPYRNEATPVEESACDAVAHHLTKSGANPRTYEAVRKIWAQRRRIYEELETTVGMAS